ncbi:MAG: NmrA/HSCARG family protein [Elusimicrobia bacterium]|nr:NmrA/HSCARG family protein [Elusimicrobiota bacterium]
MALPKTILVTGATGKQGSAVAQALLRRGQRVRALTRHPEAAGALAAAGAEIARGDFDDRASLEAAMRGCQGVFAMSTPFEAGMGAEVRQGLQLALAAKIADVRHFVYASAAGAERHSGVPHFETKRRVERRVQELALPWTILRPVWFMENFGTWLLPGIRMGSLAAPLWPQTVMHMVCLRDIGEFAAMAFLDPERFLNREITLAGDALTFPQVAEMLSKAMGHSVYFRHIPDSGAEKAVGPDMALMYRWINQVGQDVDIHALEQTYGLRMTRFSEVLANEAWAQPPLVGGRS